MSDLTTSGGTPTAPAAEPIATSTLPPAGAFGASRGTGLARGKRPTPAAAQTTPAADYQPSTIAVLRPKSEYVNPFTGETSVGASPTTPTRAEPIARAINEPAAPPAAQPVAAAPVIAKPAPVPAPVAARAPAPAAAPTAPVSRASTPPPEAPPRLNILPPEQAPRTSHSWESPGASTPAAAPREAREPRNGNHERYPRRDREGGDARPIFRPDHAERPESRDDRPDSRPARPDIRAAKLDASVPDKPLEDKSPGFFGWLISLFSGGKKPSVEKSVSSHRPAHSSGESTRHSSSHGSSSSSADGSRHEGGDRRRRRRGGRGRNRHRDGQSGGEHAPRSEGGESSGGHHRHQHSGEHRHQRSEGGGHGEGSGRAAS
jgi:hypothetical protein